MIRNQNDAQFLRKNKLILVLFLLVLLTGCGVSSEEYLTVEYPPLVYEAEGTYPVAEQFLPLPMPAPQQSPSELPLYCYQFYSDGPVTVTNALGQTLTLDPLEGPSGDLPVYELGWQRYDSRLIGATHSIILYTDDWLEFNFYDRAGSLKCWPLDEEKRPQHNKICISFIEGADMDIIRIHGEQFVEITDSSEDGSVYEIFMGLDSFTGIIQRARFDIFYQNSYPYVHIDCPADTWTYYS